MYSQGAFEAHNPDIKRTPYQKCEVKTPIQVTSQRIGLTEKVLSTVITRYNAIGAENNQRQRMAVIATPFVAVQNGTDAQARARRIVYKVKADGTK